MFDHLLRYYSGVFQRKDILHEGFEEKLNDSKFLSWHVHSFDDFLSLLTIPRVRIPNTISKIILNLYEIFECSCPNGFTGDFCEFKTEQDHLLFVDAKEDFDRYPPEMIYIPLVFNADGRLTEENAVIQERAGGYLSCSTMLNGEAIVFGSSRVTGTNRKVNILLTGKSSHLQAAYNK